jgi:DNA polymerase-3 subunit delta'
MNAAAANALLKLLEEPPAGAHFVLLTTQPARLPATVRSRCVRHHLPQPTRQEAVAWLGANGVRNAELALAQAGGAPVGALALDERFWALRRLVMRMLVDGSTDWVEAAASVSDLDVPQLVHLVQTCCWDLAAARFGGDVRYQLDERDRLASVAGRVDLRKLLAMERTLRSARSLAEHPLNPRLFAEDLLRRYSDLTRAT